MANTVIVLALGSAPRELNNVGTVQDIVNQLELGDSLSVKINGSQEDYATELADFDTVVFGEKVKGGHSDLLTHWATV